jgi:hypothetical protein
MTAMRRHDGVPPGTGFCPNHATGVKLPDDFVVTQLQTLTD